MEKAFDFDCDFFSFAKRRRRTLTFGSWLAESEVKSVSFAVLFLFYFLAFLVPFFQC